MRPLDFIIIAGPAFLAGAAAAALATYRWFLKRTTVTWAVAEQWQVSSRHASEIVSAPVSILVRGQPTESLEYLSLEIRARSTANLNSIGIVVETNEEAVLLGSRITRVDSADGVVSEGGARRGLRLDLSLSRGSANVGLHLIFTDYRRGSVTLSAPDTRVDVRRAWWLRPHGPLVLGSMSFGLPFLRYDAAATAMLSISEELKKIRKIISR
jgi:hypothetical protein